MKRAGLKLNIGLPGGPVVKNLLANAGDICSIPGPGRCHRPWGNEAPVTQLLSPHSRAHKPQVESGPRSQLGRAYMCQQRPRAAKNKYISDFEEKHLNI